MLLLRIFAVASNQQSMVPFLEHALVDTDHTLMKMVVKPGVLDQTNSSFKLSKLDLSNSENLLPCELIKLQSPHYNLLIYQMKRSDLFERMPNKGSLY